MKVIVRASFVNKDTRVKHKPGEELELSEFRAGELFGKGLVTIPEQLAEEVKEKAEKAPVKEKAEHKPAKEKAEK